MKDDILINGQTVSFGTRTMTCGLRYTVPGGYVALNLLVLRHEAPREESRPKPPLPIFFGSTNLHAPDLGGSARKPWIATPNRDVINCGDSPRNTGPDYNETVTFRLHCAHPTILYYDIYVGTTPHESNRKPYIPLNYATNVELILTWPGNDEKKFTYFVSQGVQDPTCHMARLLHLGDGSWRVVQGSANDMRTLAQIARTEN